MITVQILEPDDLVDEDDWCRPLVLSTMSDSSDYYSFESCYSKLPENNVKWIRVKDLFGSCWFGKPAKDLMSIIRYEIVRGDIPESHQLKGHKSLYDMTRRY